MYIKLEQFYLSTFDFKVKVIQISKYILPFSGEKHGEGEEIITNVLEKY